MGRTVPSFRMVIESFGVEWSEFKRALRDIDKESFECLMNYARRHAEAGTNMPNPNPFEPIIMSILIEHEKELRKIRENAKGTHS
ncbi:MAG: hypothetical protein JSW06_06170 [Thermoplasmatales archaeon]|nr:MAG: hypothetical protein JSW06_06170 [Thermoplasmatales archaeon]